MKKPAVFFDRDDTLIKNIPYLGDPSLVSLMPEARESLEKLQSHQFKLFVVSNQSGVGRGYITQEQVHAVNQEMVKQLGSDFFTEIYSAFSAPGSLFDDGRKPNPKLVLEAADCYEIDLTRSYFIGDRLSDMQCARNAGCHAVLLLTGDYQDEKSEASAISDFIAHSLKEAIDWILSDFSRP